MLKHSHFSNKIKEILDGIPFKSPKCRAILEVIGPVYVRHEFDTAYIKYLEHVSILDVRKNKSKDAFIQNLYKEDEQEVYRMMCRGIELACAAVCTTDLFVDAETSEGSRPSLQMGRKVALVSAGLATFIVGMCAVIWTKPEVLGEFLTAVVQMWQVISKFF